MPPVVVVGVRGGCGGHDRPCHAAVSRPRDDGGEYSGEPHRGRGTGLGNTKQRTGEPWAPKAGAVVWAFRRKPQPMDSR